LVVVAARSSSWDSTSLTTWRSSGYSAGLPSIRVPTTLGDVASLVPAAIDLSRQLADGISGQSLRRTARTSANQGSWPWDGAPAGITQGFRSGQRIANGNDQMGTHAGAGCFAG
jgi:hypothetical protein